MAARNSSNSAATRKIKMGASFWALIAVASLVVPAVAVHQPPTLQSSSQVAGPIPGERSNNDSNIDNRTPINSSERNEESAASQDASFRKFGSQTLNMMNINGTSIERRYKRRLKSSSLPEFSAPIGNVTAVLGRDTRLICTVEHLGQYQVAWLKEETKTIISIDTNIIITNYRIFLIPDEEERKWVLHIKDVQESDRGFYQCQVNTSPMRTTSGYLEVVVPPTIIESQTSQVAEVSEHSNVSIQCRANGHPRPSISWRREDGQPIRLNGAINLSESNDHRVSIASPSVQQQSSELTSKPGGSQAIMSHLNDVKSDRLTFYNVDRSMGGVYVCSASNGIPTQTSKRIPLHVKFGPKTSVPNKYISVSLGDQLEIDCTIEAYPKANSYWSKITQAHRLEPTARWSSHLENVGSSSTRALSYKRKQFELNEGSQRGSFNALMMQPNTSSSLDLPPDEPSTVTGGSHQRIMARFSHQTGTHKQDELPQYNGHLHNRIQLRRQVDLGAMGSDGELASSSSSPLPDTSQQAAVITSGQSVAINSPSESKGYVTVKQTAINAYTYKLRITVAKMQAEDYGQYHCISTNSLGTSESSVIVTKADKPVEREPTDAMGDYHSTRDSNNYQHDGINSKSSNQQQQPQAGVRQISTGNRVIYDTNYLQAIKTRQNNEVSLNKLQQKLKLRQYSDRNMGSRLMSSDLIVIIALIVINYLLEQTFQLGEDFYVRRLLI